MTYVVNIDMEYTTIQISHATREKLARLREYRRETYDEVLGRLVNLVPLGDEEGEYTDEFRASWMRAHDDLRKGRVVPHEEVKKRLGL
jgi:predicted transcriptional regulator